MSCERVLMITPHWTRDGGVGTHVQASALALAERGVQVEVMVAKLEAGQSAPGLTLTELPRMFGSEAAPEERVAAALRTQADVVHLHQIEDPQVVAALRAVAPVLLSAHAYSLCSSGVYYFQPGRECTRGHGAGCVPNLLAGGCAHTRYRRTLPKKYRNASRSLSALEQADLAISYSSAVDRHLANNGLSRRAVVPLFPTMPVRPGEGHATRRRVVFAGRIVRPKGVEVLIEAASRVQGEFVLCGEGRELEAMRALSTRLGLDQRVRFTGWLDAGELARELGEASVVAVPSVWPEPFGLVGIEAFASGRPVVASATGGIPDWLEHERNGLLVEPADAGALARALEQLLGDPERQAAMGQAGRETVAARFSPDRHVEALLAAYERARAGWRGARAA